MSPSPIVIRVFLTIVLLKLAEQIFPGSSGITRISGWGKEFELTLGAGRHCRGFASITQDHEVALSHGAGSLPQFHRLR